MKVTILAHARQRMVLEAIAHPDQEMPGYRGRVIAQKKLNGYVLRVIYEEETSTTVVITVYKARRARYEV